ncbi:MAG: hypothetical protein LUM44_22430 [Pyrinomonadaceae bacterium]|nr:hypothetical protein [Pyrinomonadaceae bacterium]
MRVVCYAVNGSGIGHLKRLTAIARHLRRIANEKSAPLEIFFLTSSEASHLLFAENFAAFKVPSREALAKSGIETKVFAEIARQWTAQTLKILQPDLLLVDTFPAGYYDELLENLSFCRASAVIHRSLKFDNLDRTTFYKNLARYESIIVPESEASFDAKIPSEIASKTEYFGAVLCREKGELLDRKTVRRRLNVKENEFLIYLSMGGGGDLQAETDISRFYKLVSRISNVRIVIGAGALYGGSRIYAPNVVWLSDENAFEMMPGFDAAISAAGYNSFHELLFTGVPTVFFPQRKWADDQLRRARRAAQKGAAFLFEEPSLTNEIKDLIETLCTNADARLKLSQKAREFVSRNHASEIAQYLFNGYLSPK